LGVISHDMSFPDSSATVYTGMCMPSVGEWSRDPCFQSF